MGRKTVIARRYARGLAEQVAEAGHIEEVRRELEILADALNPRAGTAYIREFADFLANPQFNAAEKIAMIADLMQQLGVGETVAAFFSMLVERNRIDLLPEIFHAFLDVSGKLTGEYTAVVQTARALSEEQSERLSQVLSAIFGGGVRLLQQIEPGLLAGAKVVVGDHTFDGTVMGRFESLKNRLVTQGVANLQEMLRAEGSASE